MCNFTSLWLIAFSFEYFISGHYDSAKNVFHLSNNHLSFSVHVCNIFYDSNENVETVQSQIAYFTFVVFWRSVQQHHMKFS